MNINKNKWNMRSVLCFIHIFLILVAVCLSEDDNEVAENVQASTDDAETTGQDLDVKLEAPDKEETTENATLEDTSTKLDSEAGSEDANIEVDSETEATADKRPAKNGTVVWPVCTANDGCKPRLNCSNLTEITDEHLSAIINRQRVVKVTEEELTQVLSNKTLPSACLMVMFYAQWCPYSIQFVPTYNLLGSTMPGLPVLAFDFGANYSEKYPMAYVPLVVLFYMGMKVYLVDTSHTAEELQLILGRMTGVKPLPLPETEEEIGLIHAESPLPMELEENYSMFYLSLLGIAFVFIINILKSEPSLSCLKALTHRFSKDKTE